MKQGLSNSGETTAPRNEECEAGARASQLIAPPNLDCVFQAILNSIPDIAWLKDRDSRFIAVNEAFANSFGRPAEDFVGKNDYDFSSVELSERYRADDREVMQSGLRKRVEEPLVVKDGEIWIETIKTPILNSRGEVIGTTGIARDITERKRAEDVLRRSREELERLVAERTAELEEANADLMREIAERRSAEQKIRRLAMAVEQQAEAVIICDERGDIEYVNPAFEQMSGFSLGEAIGKEPGVFNSDKQDRSDYANMLKAVASGAVWTGNLSKFRKDGSICEIEATVSPIRDEAGRITNYVATCRDVTHERQLERQFNQTQKMEAIGRLAGGIAHDFNNLLTSILGYSRLIAEEMGSANPFIEEMNEVIKAGERAAVLTRQLLAFSRKNMIKPHPIELNSTVLNAEKLLRRTAGDAIELTIETADQVQTVMADGGLIEQVLVNLVSNSRDAMPEGGRISIRTGVIDLDDERSIDRTEGLPGRFAVISVSDTGCGMPPDVLERCFEPFFTTKTGSKGGGLGLAVVYSLVRQFDGFFDIESSPDKGTNFRIYLPVLSGPGEASELAQSSSPGGTETILVVEDEDMVRRLAVRMLQSLGYHVIEARDGRQAVDVFDKQGEQISLLLTDVVMPHIGGQQLAEMLRSKRRDLKIIYMSGFTDHRFVHERLDSRDCPMILKPFTQKALASQIRRALDS